MGRPSVAAERTEQILRAVHACLRTHGLAGTTLERVAAVSGLSRSHVRHYVGNRDDLLRRFADWFFVGYEEHFAAHLSRSDPSGRLASALDYLFGEEFQGISDDDVVIRELMTAGVTDQGVSDVLTRRYLAGVGELTAVIAAHYPRHDAEQHDRAAYTLWTLAMGNSMMLEVGLPMAAGPWAREAAQTLLDAALGRAED